jgi:hypothetical protein
MFLVRDFDTYKTLVCDRNPKLEDNFKAKKLSYLQYAYKQFMAQTRARPSVEPNVLDLLVQHQHKALLTSLPLVQGLLDHKWHTFARQLLASWGVIMLVVFAIFEINVYSEASLAASSDFSPLETVARAHIAAVVTPLTSTSPLSSRGGGGVCLLFFPPHFSAALSRSSRRCSLYSP